MRALRALVAAAAMLVLVSSGAVAVQATTAEAEHCPDGSPGRRSGDALLCVHGDEPPPPGVDARRRPELDELRGRRLGARDKAEKSNQKAGAEEESEPDTQAEGAPDVAAGIGAEAESGTQYQIKCIGDGVTGSRVQAVYAVATDKENRSTAVVPLIRQYAADADLRINRSAAAQGAGRRVRFVTAPLPDGRCQVDVRVVFLSPTGDDTFGNMRQQLSTQGLTRADRKYLVWVDTAVGICGLGEVYNDDRPGQDNLNNRGPMFARVDAPCWGFAETHELLHTMGAVQRTAPNASAAGHCVQENDAMCYADAAGITMTSKCPTLPVQWVDCGLDDYFAAAPQAQSYLATKWNVANSAYLHPDVAPPPPPQVTVRAPDRMFAGKTATVRANIVVPEGMTSTLRWNASRADCRFGTPRQATTTFYCPATAAGDVQVTAVVVDSDGMAASNVATVKFSPPSSPRDTRLTGSVSLSSVVYGGGLRMRGRLTDIATGEGIGGMPVTLYSKALGTTEFRTKSSGLTDATGNISLPVRPSLSADLLMVAASTSTWQQSQSAYRPVTVRYSVRPSDTTATVASGDTLSLAAAVLPAREGARVLLRRPTSSGFETLTSTTVSPEGTVRLRFKPLRDMSGLRIVGPRHEQNGQGRSSAVAVDVRR